MIRIAVCEDEKVHLEYIVRMLKNWQNKEGIACLTDTYQNAEQFLFHAESSLPYDILLLDIQMGKMNGMELARYVRKKDTRVKIVFLTGITDYAIEGYEVGAVRYLLKPIKEDVFSGLMSELCKEIKKDLQECFVFTAGGKCIRQPYDTIVYIEARGHYLFMQTENSIREWKGSLLSISGELESHDFFLLRRGVYVNLSKVVQIGRETCILETGEVLPISKSRYKKLNEAFIAYFRG